MNKKDENENKKNLKNNSSNISNNYQQIKKENQIIKKTKPSYSDLFKDKLKYVYTDIGLSSGSDGSYLNLYKNSGLKIYSEESVKNSKNNEINNKINSIMNNRIKLNDKTNSRNCFSPNRNPAFKKSKTTVSKSTYNSPRRDINYSNKKISKIDLSYNNKEIINLSLEKTSENKVIDKDEIIKLQIQSNDDKIRNLLNQSENTSLNFDKQIEQLYKELFAVNEIKEVDEEEEGSLMGSKNPSKQIFNVNNNHSEIITLKEKKTNEKVLNSIKTTSNDLELDNQNKKKKIKSKDNNNNTYFKNQSKKNSKNNSIIDNKRNKKNNIHHKRSKTINNLSKINLKNKTSTNNLYIKKKNKIELNSNQKYLNNSLKENKSYLIKKCPSNESVDTHESSQKPNKQIDNTPEKEFLYKNDVKKSKSNNNSFHSSFDNESCKENSHLIKKSKKKSFENKYFRNIFNENNSEKELHFNSKKVCLSSEINQKKKDKIKNIKKCINIPLPFSNKKNLNINRPLSVNKINCRNDNIISEQFNDSNRNKNKKKTKSTFKMKSTDNIFANFS